MFQSSSKSLYITESAFSPLEKDNQVQFDKDPSFQQSLEHNEEEKEAKNLLPKKNETERLNNLINKLKIHQSISDSDENSDENYLPFKKYAKISSKRRSKIRYKRKLNEIRLNSGSFLEEAKEVSVDYGWSDSINDLVNTKVIPEWVSILQQKKVQEFINNVDTSTKQRCDAVWKKILRDARKFYRLLFNHFYSQYQQECSEIKDEYQNKSLANCVSRLFEELKLKEFQGTKYSQLIRYFIENRKVKTNALNIESEFINGEDECLGVDAEESIFENFSENKLKVYINDSLYSLLLNSLFSQFGEVYKKQMHPKARKKICCCVNILIKKD